MIQARVSIFLWRAFSLLCFLVAFEQTANAIVPLVAGAAIGAGGAIIQGLMGLFGAQLAADKQAEAAKQAADRAQAIADKTGPWMTDAARGAGNDLRYQAGLGATGATDAAGTAIAGMNTAVEGANRLLNPYTELGTQAAGRLQEGLAPDGEFGRTPTLAELQMDPGYAFRKQQGEQAIERSAAARGGVLGGGVLKDLTTFSQGAASQEYKNAFDRFRQTTQDRYSNLFQATRAGQEAAGRQGTALTSGAEYTGTVGNRAAEFGGSLTTDAARTAGGWGVNASNLAATNQIQAATQANQYNTNAAFQDASGIIGGVNAINNAITGGVRAVSPIFNRLQNPSSDWAYGATGPMQGPQPNVDPGPGTFYGAGAKYAKP